jgi:hypothetical protein
MFEWLFGTKKPDSARTSPSSKKEGREPKVYISYRRNDSVGFAGRLSDSLALSFGSQNVFVDVLAIAPGANFVESIAQEVRVADVVLVLIGPSWLTATDKMGRRRLDNPQDFVRLEIEFALRSKKPIIPVLVEGARMPNTGELSETLRELTRINAASVQHPTFHHDVERLINDIRHVVQTHASEIEARYHEPATAFISHSSADRNWVEREILQFLKENGIKPWYSAHSISSAAQWEREVLKGMKACEWFLLVVSPSAAESDWVKDELFWAMQFRPTRIVPIIMRKCDLYQFHIRLPRIQHVDFTESKTVARQKLLALFAQADTQNVIEAMPVDATSG